jgi:hypothetical protein
MANKKVKDGVPKLKQLAKSYAPSKEVNAYVSNGMKLIHSEETRDSIVTQLKSVEDQPTALAQTTVNVLQQLDRSSSNTVSPEVVMQGAAPLMEQIMEIGEASGAMVLDDEQVKQAAGMAVSLYIKKGMESGKITMKGMQNLFNQTKALATKEQEESGVLNEAPPSTPVIGGQPNVR